MIPLRADAAPLAVVGGRLCTGLLDLTDDLAALDSTGFWAVVVPFDGIPICARFADVRPATAWPGRWIIRVSTTPEDVSEPIRRSPTAVAVASVEVREDGPEEEEAGVVLGPPLPVSEPER